MSRVCWDPEDIFTAMMIMPLVYAAGALCRHVSQQTRDFEPMLVKCRWPSINQALAQRLVFTGMCG